MQPLPLVDDGSVPTVARRRGGFPWLGMIATIAFLVGAAAATMPWVSGRAPDGEGLVDDAIELAGFEPGEQATYDGLDIPGVGGAAIGVAVTGAALAVAGVVLRRPVIFLATSGAAGAVAALAGLAVVLLAWLEIDNIPFSSYIPADVRAQIPNPEVERGLWIYFLCAAAGAVLCAFAAVVSYRGRYGVHQRPAGA